MENNFVCVNQTSFRACNKGIPTGTTFSCESNKVCTSSKSICQEEDDTIKAVCSSSCGACPAADDENNMYTCLSRTQFGICIDGKVTYTSSCDANMECNADLYAQTGNICAPQCVLDFVSWRICNWTEFPLCIFVNLFSSNPNLLVPMMQLKSLLLSLQCLISTN